MARAKYQISDFLAPANDGNVTFFNHVHKILLGGGYKTKIQVTKTDGLRISYHEPKSKTTAGIIAVLLFGEKSMKVRIYGANHKAYPDTVDALPKHIENQIAKAPNCLKSTHPDKCWKGCRGYDFQIKGKRYFKCLTACFLLDVDEASVPFLLGLIEKEMIERENLREMTL
ncbi:MAG: hypothetical protein FWE21_01760 [Defluviitaleaceae bacterium]|nr:hypothetical protein [Defluviitaleaceae bacterium]